MNYMQNIISPWSELKETVTLVAYGRSTTFSVVTGNNIGRAVFKVDEGNRNWITKLLCSCSFTEVAERYTVLWRMQIFWHATSRRLVKTDWRFGRTCCLCISGRIFKQYVLPGYMSHISSGSSLLGQSQVCLTAIAMSLIDQNSKNRR